MKYSKNHEWVRIDDNETNNNFAYIGISFFAQKELGDIIYLDIDVSIIGKKMNKGDIFGTIEAVKTVSDLFMPICGKIIEINKNLLSKPELINKNYKEWMLKIIMEKNSINEYNELMDEIEYKKSIGKVEK